MKNGSITQLEWNLDELIESDDSTFPSFAQAVQEVADALVVFREKYPEGRAANRIEGSQALELLRDAEALLGRAYTLQLSIQIVATATEGRSDILLLLGQQATEMYYSCLSAVAAPMGRIDCSAMETVSPDLKKYQVFLENIFRSGLPQPCRSAAVSSSNRRQSDFSLWSEYCRIRSSMRLTIPSVDAKPLSINEVFLVMSRGRKEAREQTFNAYSNWMAENRDIFSEIYSHLVDSARRERERLRCQPWRSYSTRESLEPRIHTDFIRSSNCLSVFHRFERLRLGLPEHATSPVFNKFCAQASVNDVLCPKDAHRLLLSAFETLSQRAAALVQGLFDTGRVFTKPGRSSDRGINCVGVPQVGPFVSVPMHSCTGPLITRLAHEMGHAFQKTLAGKCSYFCHGIERLLSESIATFFELWTLNFMLESSSLLHLEPGDHLALLAPLFEDLYERTAFALYERTASQMTLEDLAKPDILSQVWRSAVEPLLTGLYTLPTEFNYWWANQSMMFRYPLAQSYYPAATVIGIALFFRAKQDPQAFMKILEDRLALGGTVAFSSWGEPFGIALDEVPGTDMPILFLEHSMTQIESLIGEKEIRK